MRQLKHTCGQALNLVYVENITGREPALACPEHGVVSLEEVEPRGAVCVVREEARRG